MNNVDYMPDYGLFEASRIACPVLPQYHPKQLMELLNSGKIRWVKAILAHLVRSVNRFSETCVFYEYTLCWSVCVLWFLHRKLRKGICSFFCHNCSAFLRHWGVSSSLNLWGLPSHSFEDWPHTAALRTIFISAALRTYCSFEDCPHTALRIELILQLWGLSSSLLLWGLTAALRTALTQLWGLSSSLLLGGLPAALRTALIQLWGLASYCSFEDYLHLFCFEDLLQLWRLPSHSFEDWPHTAALRLSSSLLLWGLTAPLRTALTQLW